MYHKIANIFGYLAILVNQLAYVFDHLDDYSIVDKVIANL